MKMRSSFVVGAVLAASLPAFAPSSWAATCALRSSSGSCLMWSNGTAAELVTDVQGSLSKHPAFSVAITPILPFNPNPPLATASGVIACANGGSKQNTSPGIQTVFIPDLTVFVPDLADLMLLQNANITKGSISGPVAKVDTADNAILPSGTLAEFVGACPNANWTVVDFVPCNAQMNVTLSNDSGTIDSATEKCTLDTGTSACSTLQWQGTATSPKFEKRFYSCTLQQ